ncbi:MAG: hypothetical protein OXF78_06845 [Rhodospirillales bacterium]|nr:hypothetical protein [Rhodospirillales bacterium]
MKRPNFSRRTFLVWVLLLVAVVALVQTERTPPQPHEGHDHGPEGLDDLPEGRFPVFAFGEPDIGSVTVAWRSRHVDFERNPDGSWFQVSHAHDHDHGHDHGVDGHTHDHSGDRPDKPDVAQITEQFEITARMLADRAIKPDRRLVEYGLERPDIVLTFRDRLNGDPLAVLRVGDLLVTGYAYYTVLERRPNRILLIPRYQINLLLALAFGDEAPSLVPERAETSGEAGGLEVSERRWNEPGGT